MFFAVTGMAAAVAAQSAQDLPACGQLCASNMIGADKSQELGCATGDIACLCTKPDFIYGLRDCSAAVCNNGQAAEVVSYGLAICRQVGVAITTGDAADATNTADDDDNVATVSTVFSTYTTDGSVVTEVVSTAVLGGAGAGDDDVSTYTSVLTDSAGETFTTTGEVTAVTDTATETETDTDAAGGAVLTTYTTDGTQVVATVVTETEDDEALTTFTTDGTQVIRTIVTETVNTDSETAALTTYTTDGTQVIATIVTETEDDETAALTTFTTDGTQVVRTIVTETDSESTGSVETTVTDTSTETATATDGDSTETGTATGTAGGSETTTSDNAAVAQMTAAPAGILAAAGIAMLLL